MYLSKYLQDGVHSGLHPEEPPSEAGQMEQADNIRRTEDFYPQLYRER